MKELLTHTIFAYDLPFEKEIYSNGGKIYIVGGLLRDQFLNKESKDLDLLINNISVLELIGILQKYGKVDVVGESFGVIKFTNRNYNTEIDIAVPRTERKIGQGHKGFEITADPFLPVEVDLSRRDFTINAMAKEISGELLDPFGGMDDLKNGVIRVVNPQAFADDPLRMLRAVSQASRFNFTIEPLTLKLIQDNAEKINEISGERILIELEKIVTKGNVRIGTEYLIKTGLHTQIFDVPFFIPDFHSILDNIKSLAEFIYVLKNRDIYTEDFFKNKLKGDIETAKTIKAFSHLDYSIHNNNAHLLLYRIFEAIKMSESVLQSEIFDNLHIILFLDFLNNKYPKSYKELEIDGNDLLSLGYSGKAIGDKLKEVLIEILSDSLENKHDKIINYLKTNND